MHRLSPRIAAFTALLFCLPFSSSFQFALAQQSTSREADLDFSKRVDFPATITHVFSRDEFEVRGGNDHIYRVSTDPDSDHFDVGAPIRVAGFADGLTVVSAFLIERDEVSSVPTEKFEKPVDVDFGATITGIDYKRDRALVKGDDGNQYRLRGDDLEDFKVGDHVRIRGAFRYGIVEVRRMDLVD